MTESVVFVRLQRFNLAAGALHALSGILIVILANTFTLSVTANYMAGPPGTTTRQLVHLLDVRLAWLISAFFFLSAVAHLVVAGPLRESYERELEKGRNPYRWIEYSVSSSLMIVAIALLTGIGDAAALLALVGVNASMIGFGWMQERYEKPGGSLVPFWLGCGAGAVPWVAIGIYLFAPGATAHAPGFVYGIYFSLFVAFNCFALVQYLQYRRIGRFADYLVGEKTYLVLSLVAKSLLAWQVFAATLATGSVH
ncbi:MAG: heliorhodopsin HeR [Acidobacteria bacterium]|nr:heliorhodopsin HeR [Acidobacteriota bacterium]